MRNVAAVPKPLLTIGDEAALALEMKPFLTYGFHRYAFVLGSDGHLIEYYMRSNYPQLDLSYHYVDKALGTAHTLYQTRHFYPSNALMVCHADNIYLEEHFNSIDLNSSFLFVNQDPVLKPYAYVKAEDGRIVGAVEKPEEFYSNLVISGLFYFKNSEEVWRATEFNFLNEIKSFTEWSLSDTVDTMVGEHNLSIKTHLIDTPIHYGTPEEYKKTIHTYDGKSELVSRAMNRITVKNCENNKIVRKESKSILGNATLDPEIRYLKSIPDQVSRYFPKVYSFTAKYYEMEFIDGEELSTLAHKGEIGTNEFIDALNSVVTALKADFYVNKEPPNRESVLFEYFFKTERRLRSFQSALKLNSNNLVINEIKCLNPVFIVNELRASTKLIETIDKPYFAIIHGDLNLTNIMYNPENRAIRFLDPRGKYGREVSIYGDPSYDLMRIAACIIYSYDTIVKGLYSLDVSGESVDIRVKSPDVYLESRKELEDILSDAFPDIPPISYELQAVLYFLNLLPFHSDSIERSLAYYYWGTYNLNLWLEKEGDEYGIVF